MKFVNALEIISQDESNNDDYMVSFERLDRNILISDNFPDKYGGKN